MINIFVTIAWLQNTIDGRIHIGVTVNGIIIAFIRFFTRKRDGTVLLAECSIAGKGSESGAVRKLKFKGVSMEFIHLDKGGQIYIERFLLVLAVHQGKTQMVVVIYGNSGKLF